FNNAMARQAVNLALDRRALQRLASGFLTPGCYFLPPQLPGHPTAPCPYGDPNAAPDLNKAKQLVQQSGLAGTPVTVYGETRTPRRQYVDYYTSVLNQLGFHATEQILQDSVYFTTIGNASTNPQTGFADWSQDFPNPSDFYLLLDGTAIQPVKNQNFSKVNDPQIQAALAKLYPVPATQLSTVGSQWAQLDQYVAQQAYEAVYGYEQVPMFMSNRINFNSAVFHPVYYNDWSSWQLNSSPIATQPAGTSQEHGGLRLAGEADPDLAGEGAGEGQPTAGVGPYRLDLRRLRRHHVALAFGVIFLLVVAVSAAAPLYSRYIAHTGPNDNHITETITVSGHSENV